jgi:septal ring factor EnvC (AmiA/AmiB activator)
MNEVDKMEPIEKELSDFKVLVAKEIEELKGCYKELDKRQDGTEREMVEVKGSIRRTDERVDGLESTLKEISENTKWIKRTITKAGISAGFTLLVAVIIGLVTFYISSLGG